MSTDREWFGSDGHSNEIEGHFVQLFKRRGYLIEQLERNPNDRWRARELEGLEWALVELSREYPEQSIAAQQVADELMAGRARRQGAYR